MEEDRRNVIGYFHSLEVPYNATEEQEVALEQKRIEFVVSIDKVKDRTDLLDYRDYGTDLHLILFQFHLFPNDETLSLYKGVENYRSKEKSIGINISIDNQFFKFSDQERRRFLNDMMLDRMKELVQRLSRKKLDFEFEKLLKDFELRLMR